MNTRALLVGTFMFLAVVSFYAGAYYIKAMGGTLPFLTAPPAQQYDSVVGKVSAVSSSSVTLTLYDGTIKTIPVSASTQVMMIPTPTPASIDSLGAGTSVLVAFPLNGEAAQMIQILSQPLASTSQPH